MWANWLLHVDFIFKNFNWRNRIWQFGNKKYTIFYHLFTYVIKNNTDIFILTCVIANIIRRSSGLWVRKNIRCKKGPTNLFESPFGWWLLEVVSSSFDPFIFTLEIAEWTEKLTGNLSLFTRGELSGLKAQHAILPSSVTKINSFPFLL